MPKRKPIVPKKPPSMTIHCREHELASKPRFRVWTDEMAEQGIFNIVENADLQAFKVLADKMTLLRFKLHYDECDGRDPNCDCRIFTYGETITP